MKRRDLERHLREHGCRLVDEGGRHSKWGAQRNPAHRCASPPRDRLRACPSDLQSARRSATHRPSLTPEFCLARSGSGFGDDENVRREGPVHRCRSAQARARPARVVGGRRSFLAGSACLARHGRGVEDPENSLHWLVVPDRGPHRAFARARVPTPVRRTCAGDRSRARGRALLLAQTSGACPARRAIEVGADRHWRESSVRVARGRCR